MPIPAWASIPRGERRTDADGTRTVRRRRGIFFSMSSRPTSDSPRPPPPPPRRAQHSSSSSSSAMTSHTHVQQLPMDGMDRRRCGGGGGHVPPVRHAVGARTHQSIFSVRSKSIVRLKSLAQRKWAIQARRPYQQFLTVLVSCTCQKLSTVIDSVAWLTLCWAAVIQSGGENALVTSCPVAVGGIA